MSQTASVENPNEKKKKHRWYHWFFLVLAVLVSLFNIFEGVIIPSGYINLITENINAILAGEELKVAPESVVIEGDDVVYVNSKNSYRLSVAPDNAHVAPVLESYTVSIEGSSEGAWIENDYPRDVILYAGGEGTVQINVYCSSFPNATGTMTVEVVKEPITSIDTTLSTETELICGQSSHLLVNNDDYSVELSRINFYSTNTDVASIDEEGYIKTLSAGTAEVYAVSAEDESVVSEKIQITVTDGSIVEPTSISVEPIKMYAKTLQKADAVFNNGNGCSDCVYKITCEDESVVRQGEYLYSDEARDPINIRVSSVYDSSVYCDTTVEFVEVKCTGLELVSPSPGSLLSRSRRHEVIVDVLSEVEGVDVTYDDLSYEIIEGGEYASMTDNVVVCSTDLGEFTLRISLVQDPSFNIEVTYQTYFTSSETGIDYDKLFGHYLLYAVNGVLMCLVMYYFCTDEKKKKRNVLVILLFVLVGLLLSVLGEFVQYFFNTARTASWSDVGLNFAGYMTGFAGVWLILFIMYLIKKHKKKNAKNTLTKKL